MFVSRKCNVLHTETCIPNVALKEQSWRGERERVVTTSCHCLAPFPPSLHPLLACRSAEDRGGEESDVYSRREGPADHPKV